MTRMRSHAEKAFKLPTPTSYLPDAVEPRVPVSTFKPALGSADNRKGSELRSGAAWIPGSM
jgi:hypothetical protein